MPNTTLSPHGTEGRAAAPIPFDPDHARRLALRCESIAAAGKSWAIILAGRLGTPRPMTPAAVDVAAGMVREIANAADLLHATSQVLQAHLKNPIRG